MNVRVIAVCQQKGGDGKTTISRLIAEYANKLDLRVLLIDMDPQCNLSQRYLVMETDPLDPDGVLPPVHPDFKPDVDVQWNGRCSIVAVYRGTPLHVYDTKYTNIKILPGHGSQMRQLELITQEQLLGIVNRLSEVLATDLAGQFDLVVIDTPPSKGPLVQSALRAATHMLVPAQMEPQSQEGLRGMLQLWRRENRVRAAGKELNLVGILPNKVRKVALHTGIMDGLFGQVGIKEYMMPCVLGQRTILAETDHPLAKPKSVFDMPAADKAKQEADQACEVIFERMGFGQKRNLRRA